MQDRLQAMHTRLVDFIKIASERVKENPYSSPSAPTEHARATKEEAASKSDDLARDKKRVRPMYRIVAVSVGLLIVSTEMEVFFDGFRGFSARELLSSIAAFACAIMFLFIGIAGRPPKFLQG